MITKLRIFLFAAALMPALVHGGTPLICHPYAIGNAKSLPGGGADWKGVDPGYNRANLVRDTLGLLTRDMPVIVRMETLRRAAIYATAGMHGFGQGFSEEDRANANAILEKLQERATAAKGSDRALALFDEGFFVETLRHTGVKKDINGYELLAQARALRGPDADMEFALALASSWPMQRGERDSHLAKARAGAKPGTLLAQNLPTHFGES